MNPDSPEFEKDIDELNEEGFEDFESMLKPLSKGLGFHHQEEAKTFKKDHSAAMSLTKKSQMLKKDFEESVKESVEEKPKQNIKAKAREGQNLNMGELSPFYQNKKSEPSTERVEKSLKKKSRIGTRVEDNSVVLVDKEAGIIVRFFAYLFDLISVSILVSCSVGLITLSAQIPLSEIRIFLSREFAISFAPIFVLFYIFYFMLLEKTSFSTLGKRIFGLQVVSLNDQSLGLGTTFLRCFISILSIITLGLPVFLNWQDKLTNTKVIKKKNL